MGQRTQIWIEDQIARPVSYDGKMNYEPVYKNFTFHQQWGFGKGLVNRLINLLNRSTMTNYREYDFGVDWSEFFAHDADLMQEYQDEMFINQDGDNVYDFKLKKAPREYIEDFLYSQDNNDGYLIVRLSKEPKTCGDRYFEAGFYVADTEAFEESGRRKGKLKYIEWDKYLKEYDIEPLYIKFAKAAFNYYSDNDIKGLIKDVLKDWNTPLYEQEENEE